MRKGLFTLYLSLALFTLACVSALPARGEVVLTGFDVTSESCSPANNLIDPGEKVTVTVRFRNDGTEPTTWATARVTANANVIPLSSYQIIGVLAVGGESVLSFDLVAQGTCGQAFDLVFTVRDGSVVIGTPTLHLRFGAPTLHTPLFLQTGDVVIPTSGFATPYPSTLVVSSVTGVVNSVVVDIYNLSHTNPADLDILLVAPDGKKILLMSDAGGTTDIGGVDLTFSDGASNSLPSTGPLASGLYKPTNYSAGDVFESPAPAAPYSTDLGILAGTDPNGTWKLYVMDDTGGNSGFFTSWSLTVRNTTYACCSEAPAPSVVAEDWHLLAESCTPPSEVVDPFETVTVRFAYRNAGTGPAAHVTSEVVATPLVQPLSGASSESQLDIGDVDYANHQLIVRASAGMEVPVSLKLKSGGADLATLTYTVRLGTLIATATDETVFRNPNELVIGAPGMATPYPSPIWVTNVWSDVDKVRVRLDGVSHTGPDDLDVLLMGPTGQTVLLMSDAGGSADISNVNITFDDDALISLPDGTAIATGTYKPSNYGVMGDPFSDPAPDGPYGATLSAFNGITPNGTWRLFVVDDELHNSGSISGWTLMLTCGAREYVYTAGPKAIPNTNTMETTVFVGDYGYVEDINVKVRADHPYTEDLNMTLIGPDGTEVPLVHERGGSGNNFGTGTNDCNGTPTVFTDEAELEIGAGSAPFATAYKPESRLSVFDGKPLRGTWHLRITDYVAGNAGNLGCWKLQANRVNSTEIVQATALALPTEGKASSYPSTITVSGVAGRVVGVNVHLLGLTHPRPDDLDIMLVSPDGAVCILMSDAGGSDAVTDLNVTFTEAGTTLPNGGPLAGAWYRPANYLVIGESDSFPAPAPSGKKPADLAVFRGIYPNGEWKLYVMDDTAGMSGSIAGWTLTLHTAVSAGCWEIPYTAADVQWAFGIACGMIEGTPYSCGRLDVAHGGASEDVVDMADVAALQRKVKGLDPNP